MNFLLDCNGVDIPDPIVKLIHMAIIIIQVVVPILLILWGSLDFAKGVIAQDEDKIKAGQKKFIQRAIAAVIVFLIVTIVKLIIGVVGTLEGTGNEAGNLGDCISSIVAGEAGDTTKTTKKKGS